MTSKGEAQETSEFLRRRQLRLQQVREQSKDIAKKIRQRAKVEKLRQVVELDEKKERDYKLCQDKFVKKLEELYSRGLDNVGSGHKQARGLSPPVNPLEKTDLSHLRGKEAAAEVKRQKQLKLDELKKSLDRKVQAREAANVLSREKSASASNKLSIKTSNNSNKQHVSEATKPVTENAIEEQDLKDKESTEQVSRIDMGTQWDIDLLPPQWEPNVPPLAIPQDDGTKHSEADKDNGTEKQKKTNLFALSDEMPSSLRGGVANHCDTGPTKLSSTLVSEYIQNRVLRLREPEVTSSKPHSEELQNLRQTIIRSRPLKPEGSAYSNICHVVEGQVFPVPLWHPETSCYCQSPRSFYRHKQSPEQQRFPSASHSNKVFGSFCPVKRNLVSSPVSEMTRPLIPRKCFGHNELSVHAGKNGSLKGKESDNLLTKKKSVTMYNHSTRDSRDVPLADERVVHRDGDGGGGGGGRGADAYARALDHAAPAPPPAHNAHRRTLPNTNKVAVTRQNVEKEYKDTIAFLNNLPKNKNSRPINNAFKEDHRILAQKENRQRILQQEFKNIEEESRRQDLQGIKLKSRFPERSPSKRSKSPSELNVDNLNERDFQYSWMPVPESDSKLAVHAIPGSGGGGGAGAGGARGRADCYHEYRSRHKHTPPTRDPGAHHSKRKLQTVVFQDDDSDSASPPPSDDSSPAPRRSDPPPGDDQRDNPSPRDLTDTERIIIYKILNHKHRKKSKTKLNGIDNLVESTEGSKNTENHIKGAVTKTDDHNNHVAANSDDPLSVDNLTEGIYEVAGDNQDNLESMYNTKLDKNQSNEVVNKADKRNQGPNTCSSDAGDRLLQPRKKCTSSKCKGHKQKGQSTTEPPPSTSEQAAAVPRDDCAPPAALFKLMDEQQKQESNFYIGATGFLKHDAYELIIQLRKNDTQMTKDIAAEQKTSDSGNAFATNTNTGGSQPLESKGDIHQKQSDDSNYSEAIAEPCSGTDHASAGAINVLSTNLTENHKEESESKVKSVNVQPTKIMLDRSVATSFKDFGYTDTPLPEPSTKSDPVPRAATSACTQTTPSPPNPRPVYIHMSSSTSTAYMSPPEVVLPNFFRRGDKSCRKSRRHSRNVEKHEESRLIHREHHCKKYSSCKIFEKVTDPKANWLNIRDIYKEKKESTLSSSVSHRKKKCSKHKTKGDCEVGFKQQSRKLNQHQNTDKQRNTKSTVMHGKKNKTSAHSGKSYLSPMIKEYIHKLLSLNRDGIRAIQIINQDCSSVNTPASSIINLPTNVGNQNYRQCNLDIPSHDFSLEQFKSVLKQHIFLHNNATLPKFTRPENTTNGPTITRDTKSRKSNAKNKRLHKVKSLNISKKIAIKPSVISTDGLKKGNCYSKKRLSSAACREDSSPSENVKENGELGDKSNSLKTDTTNNDLHKRNIDQCAGHDSSSEPKGASSMEEHSHGSNGGTLSHPINISTQTCRTADGEINFIKLAEDKLQNMEKIADLTEKCTKRLSNLAKVLEEVRKNKSLAYSQVSTVDSTSDSETKSDKAVTIENEDLIIPSAMNIVKSSSIEYNVDSTDYEYLVPSIPKPTVELPEMSPPENVLSDNGNNTEYVGRLFSPASTNEESRVPNTRCRNKPPPALLRIHLKRPQDNVVPHELSTVIEVDSPLSVKLKQHSSTVNANQSANHFADSRKISGDRELSPDSAPSIDDKLSNDKIKVMYSDSSEDSKLQMMDLNQFNEIMLRPFVSLQEYAREHYDRSKDTRCGSVPKDIGLTEDISSLHSDGSLPDVVAELLKRKLITEPFRFDTASNVNSTTISSESTLSALALSKVHKDRHKSKLSANKENVGETSDSLSISSNPDLENAFKKLGMGWASSTLKKTKERLALSSSSNTSSSSLSQIKFKSSAKQDELLTDAGWTLPSLPKKPALKHRLDASKNVEQQTSFSNGMTVKEFLTKELAKKITFTDKSIRNESNAEFVSLFETKLPEDLKNSSQTILDENSGDSAPSGNNNRARTSTPVKLFKSMTYQSSSSSNMSNGLFSNADDLSSVKLTSASLRGRSASEKDDLTIPNCSLKMRKTLSDCSKTDSC